MRMPRTAWSSHSHNPFIIHITMTLDATYLCGSIAGVFSVLQQAMCPENIDYHFIATHHCREDLHCVITATFSYLKFHFDHNLVKGKISYSVCHALDQPLNYARIYLADLLSSGVRCIIYFDSDFELPLKASGDFEPESEAWQLEAATSNFFEAVSLDGLSSEEFVDWLVGDDSIDNIVCVCV
jgi:hypothetical protein